MLLFTCRQEQIIRQEQRITIINTSFKYYTSFLLETKDL